MLQKELVRRQTQGNGEEWATRGYREKGPGASDGRWGGERTIWRGCRRGHRYTGTIVQSLPVGTGADRPTGAQEAEPLTLLAVTGVGHCRDRAWTLSLRAFPEP